MALIATFVIGVLAASQPLLAAAAGVLVVVLLVSRSHLHAFARTELSEQELRDAVRWRRPTWSCPPARTIPSTLGW